MGYKNKIYYILYILVINIFIFQTYKYTFKYNKIYKYKPLLS